MTSALEDGRRPIGSEALADGLGETGPTLPLIDPRAFDVGLDCPQDDLQRRHNEARARLLLNPTELGPPLRWQI